MLLLESFVVPIQDVCKSLAKGHVVNYVTSCPGVGRMLHVLGIVWKFFTNGFLKFLGMSKNVCYLMNVNKPHNISRTIYQLNLLLLS